MSTATPLAPPLTPLDRRVLAMIDRPTGVRCEDVARRTRQPVGDVRQILRGLEHLGLACGAGGWWRRVDA